MNDDWTSELSTLWIDAEDHVERGRFYKAIEIYKYILIKYVDDSLAIERAHTSLARIFMMLGETDLGHSHIRKALSYNPENPRCHYLLGRIYGRRYEWENAIHEYKAALEREPAERSYQFALGEAIFKSGDKLLGMEYLLKAAALYPANSGVLSHLATAYMSLGDIAVAKAYAEEAVETNPEDLMAWVVLRRVQSYYEESKEWGEG